MKWKRNVSFAGMLAGCLIALPSLDAWALAEGRGAGGEPYLTGGVGEGEREVLNRRRPDFNVRITTAAKQSGAYLAEVHVKVVDAANRTVLETALGGPLMFIRLAPGQYTIVALLGQQKQQRAVSVGAQGHRELYFYFDVAVDTAESATKSDASRPKP